MALNNTTDIKIKVDHELSDIAYIVSGTTLVIVGITGFTLNLLIIISILQDMKKQWTPINVALLNLSFADFLMASIGVPFSSVAALSGGWPWSYELCTWYGWLMTTLGIASIGSLAAMALDRWILIVAPIKPFTTRHATILSIFVWIYALSTSTPPFFGFGKFGPDARNISCSIDWESDDSESEIQMYVGFLFTFAFIIPLLIILFSYISILVTLRRVKKRVSARRKQEERVTKMVAVMIVGYHLGWLPYAIVSLTKQFFHTDLPPEVCMIPAIVAKSSSAYNPIIYAYLNPQFTKSVRKFFTKKDEIASSRIQKTINKSTDEIAMKIQIQTQ